MRWLMVLVVVAGCFESHGTDDGPRPDGGTTSILEVILRADALTTGDVSESRVRLDGEFVARRALEIGEDLSVGVRVAAVMTTDGTHVLEIALADSSGAEVIRRTANVTVRGNTVFTFEITAGCTTSADCSPGETCTSGRCEPDAGCPGSPDCECDCTIAADCMSLGECDVPSCDSCMCSHRDDDSLCPPSSFCEAGSCIDACMCLSDDDCPPPPPFGCARSRCTSCDCEIFADSALCAPGENCDPDTFECVGTAMLEVVLRTDYLPVTDFTQVRTRIDGARPVVHVAETRRDYVRGVTVANVEVEFGMHEIELSFRGLGETRFRRVDMREDTTVSILVTR